jgi:hypothetical protein
MITNLKGVIYLVFNIVMSLVLIALKGKKKQIYNNKN